MVRRADLESEASADSESEASADNRSALCGTKKTWKGAKALRARVNLLERLYRRSPRLPLSFGGQDEWLRFGNSWAKIAGEKHKEKTGWYFTKGINDCLEQRCCYYAGKTGFNQGSYRDEDDHLCWVDRVGDKTAFETYVKKCTEFLPKSVVSCYT